ncbi:hypothetical protein [Paenibacillus crassostreae]|uniref:hypothetical protein n=1 Tax=Paenibacillus crassostreae TaxID=1763538 RepID=UPI000AB78F69|nr:hypothetical protein [Paenibacillus crassostreae]
MTTRSYRNQVVSYEAYAKGSIMEDFYEQANRKEQKRNMKKKKYAKKYVIQRLRQSDNR